MVSVSETAPKRSYISLVAVLGGIVAIASLFLYWVDISTVFSYNFFEIPYAMKATAIKVVEGTTDIPNDWHIYCPALAGVFAIVGAAIGVGTVLRKKSNKLAYIAIIACGLLALQFSVLFAAWNFDVVYVVTGEDQAAVGQLYVVLQACLGDPTCLETVRQNAIQAAIAGGMDPAIASGITAEAALEEAVDQINALYGLNLADPAVQAALASFNPSDFTAGNELVVGYMQVQNVVTTGFWVSIVGGILVAVTGIVGTLRALRN